MDLSKKNVSIAAVALAAIVATCWLGLRRRPDPPGQPPVLTRKAAPAAGADPAAYERNKSAGEPRAERSIKRARGRGDGRALDPKGRRRQGKQVKEPRIYPDA